MVDGPWKLASLTSDGTATFVPNPRYSGPDKPHLARFVELPFTSADAEFSVLRAGPASGGPGTSGQQISVGYVPDNDLPQQPALRSQGYQLIRGLPVRLRLHRAELQQPEGRARSCGSSTSARPSSTWSTRPGWIHAYYDGLGVPTYSPVPASPANPYSDARASVNPYPFSVPAARALLAAHGWSVVPGGVTPAPRPGTAAGECGAGIKARPAARLHASCTRAACRTPTAP